MQAATAAEAFAALPHKLSRDEYNFAHFRTRHVWHDAERTLSRNGIAPGEPALDFTFGPARGDCLCP